MRGGGLTLFSLSGFRVRLDPSWIFIALLVTWSLSTGFFPQQLRGLPRGAYWLMGILGAAGLFLSIVFHEFCHSVVARRQGLPMEGITLFFFGGIAEMREDPRSPKVEFLMAAAGPLSSLVAFVVFAGLARGASALGWPDPVRSLFGYLSTINLLLALFNLVPAFPLDGGRILRAAIWKFGGDLRRATRIAAGTGSAFGILLILLGAMSLFAGNPVNGLWLILIGMFIKGAAATSYRRLELRSALADEPVARFMTASPVAVAPELSLRGLVDDFIYRHHHQRFPVVRDGVLVGCVTAARVKEVPRERWDEVTVEEAMQDCGPGTTVGPSAGAAEALGRMQRSGRPQLMVVDDGRLVGVLSLRDLLGSLELRRQLEGE